MLCRSGAWATGVLHPHDFFLNIVQQRHGIRLSSKLRAKRDVHGIVFPNRHHEAAIPAIFHAPKHLMERTLVRADDEEEVRQLLHELILGSLADWHALSQLAEIALVNVIGACPETLSDF
jgi:hypothetical protein